MLWYQKVWTTRETDCHQAPLTLCLRYPNLDISALFPIRCILYLTSFIYIYIYIYLYTYMSILLYGWTTWTLTKKMEKKFDGNYTRMLRALLNKFWRQHPTKQQLYGHLPLITKTIKIRPSRHAAHCWRSRNEIICDGLLWTPSHRRAKTGGPARTYIQQLYVETECSPEDPLEAMNDREGWRERVWDIHADGTTRWYIYMYIYIYIYKYYLVQLNRSWE